MDDQMAGQCGFSPEPEPTGEEKNRMFQRIRQDRERMNQQRTRSAGPGIASAPRRRECPQASQVALTGEYDQGVLKIPVERQHDITQESRQRPVEWPKVCAGPAGQQQEDSPVGQRIRNELLKLREYRGRIAAIRAQVENLAVPGSSRLNRRPVSATTDSSRAPAWEDTAQRSASEFCLPSQAGAFPAQTPPSHERARRPPRRTRSHPHSSSSSSPPPLGPSRTFRDRVSRSSSPVATPDRAQYQPRQILDPPPPSLPPLPPTPVPLSPPSPPPDRTRRRMFPDLTIPEFEAEVAPGYPMPIPQEAHPVFHPPSIPQHQAQSLSPNPPAFYSSEQGLPRQPCRRICPQAEAQPTRSISPQGHAQPTHSISPQGHARPIRSISPQEHARPIRSISPQGHARRIRSISPQGHVQPIRSISPQGHAQPIRSNSSQGHAQPIRSISPQGHARPIRSISPQGHVQPIRSISPQGHAQPIRSISPQGHAQPIRSISPQGHAQPTHSISPQGHAQPTRSISPNGLINSSNIYTPEQRYPRQTCNRICPQEQGRSTWSMSPQEQAQSTQPNQSSDIFLWKPENTSQNIYSQEQVNATQLPCPQRSSRLPIYPFQELPRQPFSHQNIPQPPAYPDHQRRQPTCPNQELSWQHCPLPNYQLDQEILIQPHYSFQELPAQPCLQPNHQLDQDIPSQPVYPDLNRHRQLSYPEQVLLSQPCPVSLSGSRPPSARQPSRLPLRGQLSNHRLGSVGPSCEAMQTSSEGLLSDTHRSESGPSVRSNITLLSHRDHEHDLIASIVGTFNAMEAAAINEVKLMSEERENLSQSIRAIESEHHSPPLEEVFKSGK